MRKLTPLLVITLLLGLLAAPAMAQQPVVYGLFFYSPSCPHCHIVMDDHWPAFDEEFGEQLQVLFIDVSQRQGSMIMSSATRAMGIQSNGVPMLIIGEEVMIGSRDIPQRAPVLIREGLRNGGIGYPPVPDIELVFEAAGVQFVAPSERPGLMDDPANLFAIVVLLGLIGTIGVVVVQVARGTPRRQKRRQVPGMSFREWAMVIGAALGVLLAGSLLLGSFNDGVTFALAAAVLVSFVVLAFGLLRNRAAGQWATPLMLIAGLLVAGYLAYVETTLSEATCGAMGNCNLVQQSPYAKLFGVPIGVVGIFGYVAMLVVWGLSQRIQAATLTRLFFVMALGGAAFSIYLTYLEPFVIGATCVWCLTSAVVMTMLVWLSAPIPTPKRA